MSAGRPLCLNMIVKNEAARIERCLRSVAPWIGCWVICDTGSTDGTQEIIERFFAERNIPGFVDNATFHNFEQARNDALAEARGWDTVSFDYLLLVDADMEMVVEDPSFRDNLTAPAYRLNQRGGNLIYRNTRLLRRDVPAQYHGVTHEYLDVAGETPNLDGAWFVDHADGANRPGKFDRDARLLEKSLRTDPENGRSWYYLGQSKRDAGQFKEAVKAYGKRALMSGWAEEGWSAKLEESRCQLRLGHDAEFIKGAWAAFNMRPWRAEPLYDLARHYRERGMNEAAAVVAKHGMAIPRPVDDILFVEDYPYTAGLREEFSICANYCAGFKTEGALVCQGLTNDPDVPEQTRALARANLRFYTDRAPQIMPSFSARQVDFTPPDGWKAMNPSVTRFGNQMMMVQRTVNYVISEAGTYDIAGGGHDG